MGWLFAVALGMQEGRTRAVWRALTPLALGHALAVGAAVLAAAALYGSSAGCFWGSARCASCDIGIRDTVGCASASAS